MKVAFIKPPHSQSLVRGVGFFANRLAESLNKIPGVSVTFKNLSFNPFAYSGYDLVHFPYFDLTFPTLPPIRRYKTTVTLHDLTPLKFPKYFPFGIRGKVVWPFQQLLLKTVNGVFTDSFCSKDDIQNIIGVKNVSVVYGAADSVFRPLNLKRENYVLYVGGVNWNKNLVTLIEACQKNHTPLVLVGKEFTTGATDNIEDSSKKKIIDLIKNDKTVQVCGYVETDELVKIYNKAKVYVQPSIYEGFGLPVLEAMKCGTPVICGRNSSLVEIAGEAVTYANVTNVNELADRIEHIENSGKELDQAAKFSWERAAKETYEVFKKVLAGN